MAYSDNVDRLAKNGIIRARLSRYQRDVLNDLSREEVNFLIRIKKQMGGPDPWEMYDEATSFIF